MTVRIGPGDIDCDLLLGGTWTPVAADVFYDAGVGISRGSRVEGGQIERAEAQMVFDNRDGRYSPRNPTGPYYGQLGRNTRLRLGVHAGLTRMVSLSGIGGGWSTPDNATVSITGDIDVRVDCMNYTWRQQTTLAYKWATAGGQRSWFLLVTDDGTLQFFWSTDGVDFPSAISTVAVPAHGRFAVRATLDVNNGAAGNTTTFYTAPTISGTWTQLGDPVINAGVTSIFDSTSPIIVDAQVDMSEWFAIQVRSGIGGTAVANPDFTIQADGATSFADAAGRTWSQASILGANDAPVTNKRMRISGEVPEWTSDASAGGRLVVTPVQASGVLRRLSASSTVLQSVMRRALTFSGFPPVAYWPCEEEANATQIASGIGGPAMSVSGSPAFASYTGFACSAPLPTFNGSRWVGEVPTYTGTGDVQVRFLLMVPATGGVAGEIINFTTTGTAGSWALVYGAGGTLRLLAAAPDGTSILDTGAIAFSADGTVRRVSVELQQNGADIDYSITTLDVGESIGGQISGTLAGRTVSACTRVQVNRLGQQTDMAIGHISVHDLVTSIYDLSTELNAYIGEAAGRRIERVCSELGVVFRVHGDLDDTVAMGAQPAGSGLAVITECVEADQGILYEPREFLGLGYRPQSTLYDQIPVVALTYGGGGLSAARPSDDDQPIANDVTVTRSGGSSYTATQESGPLNVLGSSQPQGVGRYQRPVTINVESDTDLPDQAGWRLHLGTVDEARYPEIRLNMAHPRLAADTAAVTSLITADLGDRLTISDPPVWLPPPDDIDVIIRGYTEQLRQRQWEISTICTPASPYTVGAYDDTGTFYFSDGTTTAEALDTTETGVDVSTPSGPVWTHADGDYDIVIGGERMTVTAVSGAGAAQTFTVTRSVNGVVKSHLTGATVELAVESALVYTL